MIPADDEEQDEGSDEVIVWDTNWKSLEAFLACSSAWRRLSGMSSSIMLGLDYAGLGAILDRFAGPLVGNRRAIARVRAARDRLFDDLQTMEFAALEAFAEVAE